MFGPAQRILADPGRQSAKFIAAFTDPPPPRMAESPGALIAGILLIAWIYAGVYAWLSPRLPGGTLRRALTFGLIAWALMVPWFEFYLPWNVMREPLALVLIEAMCWLVVMLAVGVSVAGVQQLLDRRQKCT